MPQVAIAEDRLPARAGGAKPQRQKRRQRDSAQQRSGEQARHQPAKV
ncbi:Uncharacterised protein [Klebsiella pneumoniae]|nr:Uncharacterised protein [Klebsiella pneumoniae]